MSGFSQSPPGPRDENATIASPWPAPAAPAGKLAVAPGLAATKARRASASGFSRCTVGSQWLSVMASSCAGLASSMPAAPPWKTLKPRSTRPGPRSQTTILPVNSPGGAGARQPTLL